MVSGKRHYRAVTACFYISVDILMHLQGINLHADLWWEQTQYIKFHAPSLTVSLHIPHIYVRLSTILLCASPHQDLRDPPLLVVIPELS